MRTFEIHWLAEMEPPIGWVSVIEAEDFAGAMWEATRTLRAHITSGRADVEQGLYGSGFQIYEIARCARTANNGPPGSQSRVPRRQG